MWRERPRPVLCWGDPAAVGAWERQLSPGSAVSPRASGPRRVRRARWPHFSSVTTVALLLLQDEDHGPVRLMEFGEALLSQ